MVRTLAKLELPKPGAVAAAVDTLSLRAGALR
jgi:hypothetical protein